MTNLGKTKMLEAPLLAFLGGFNTTMNPHQAKNLHYLDATSFLTL